MPITNTMATNMLTQLQYARSTGTKAVRYLALFTSDPVDSDGAVVSGAAELTGGAYTRLRLDGNEITISDNQATVSAQPWFTATANVTGTPSHAAICTASSKQSGNGDVLWSGALTAGNVAILSGTVVSVAAQNFVFQITR